MTPPTPPGDAPRNATRQIAYDAMLAVKAAREIDDADYAMADAIYDALLVATPAVPDAAPTPEAAGLRERLLKALRDVPSDYPDVVARSDAVMAIDAALTASPQPERGELDVAWAEAEAALPISPSTGTAFVTSGGVGLSLTRGDGVYWAAWGQIEVNRSTPAAALRALRVALDEDVEDDPAVQAAGDMFVATAGNGYTHESREAYKALLAARAAARLSRAGLDEGGQGR